MSKHSSVSIRDVILAAPPEFFSQAPLSDRKKWVLFKMSRCGTGQLGRFVYTCPSCHAIHTTPKACQDRHCPNCGQSDAAQWADRMTNRLVAGDYHHLVISLPPQLRPLALENQNLVYSIFMIAVKDTVLEFAQDPQHLGATPAGFQFLHTWNGKLEFHLHSHTILSAGGLDQDSGTWVEPPRPGFFAPVKAIATVVRGKFLQALRKLYNLDKLSLNRTANSPLQHTDQWQSFIDDLYHVPWMVYCEPIRDHPTLLIRYLSTYVNRAAISNKRIVRLHDGHVTFHYNERIKKNGRVIRTISRSMTLPVEDFILRFATHILPKGFKRIRSFGLLAPSKTDALQQAQRALAPHPLHPQPVVLPIEGDSTRSDSGGIRCPYCNEAILKFIDIDLPSSEAIAASYRLFKGNNGDVPITPTAIGPPSPST